MIRTLLVFHFFFFAGSTAFLEPHSLSSRSLKVKQTVRPPRGTPLVLSEKKETRDVSRSGTRQERLNRLAELEESRVETDKGFVLQAAGGFVAFIVLMIVAAYASGLLTQI